MATFRVGQRVRVVKSQFVPDSGFNTKGKEATVTGYGPGYDPYNDEHYEGHYIVVDGIPNTYCAPEGWIEPLTPPAADSWALDKVKQVTKPQHTEPVAPKVRERVS